MPRARPAGAPGPPRDPLPRGARARAAIVVERLRAAYPATCALHHENPWQLLVATILSAQCTDERVNQVTPALFARYPTPQALAAARIEDVEDIIRPTGFFRSKARALVEMSQDLVTRYGGEVPSQMEELVRLRGVGRKTANVVLGVAFGNPALAVDTHVSRVARRLGLTRHTEPERIEEDLCAVIPPEEWTGTSLRLILHGRQVCHARRPACDRCVLADVCPSAQLLAGAAPDARRLLGAASVASRRRRARRAPELPGN